MYTQNGPEKQLPRALRFEQSEYNMEYLIGMSLKGVISTIHRSFEITIYRVYRYELEIPRVVQVGT